MRNSALGMLKQGSEKVKKRSALPKSEQNEEASANEALTLQANQIFVSVNNNFLSPQNRPTLDELDHKKLARPWSLSNVDLNSIVTPKVTSEYSVPKEFLTSD